MKLHRFNPFVPFPREMEADLEELRSKHEDDEGYLSEADRLAREVEDLPTYFNEDEL